jgi:fatty acid desaturase
MTATNVYQPGVCNIGPAEIRQRRMSGYLGAAVAVVFLVLAFALGWSAWVRLLVALPVALAATGFLQAAFHFCVRFGTQGLFNFGDLGTQEAVHETEYRRKDQRKALLIVGLTALIAAVVAIAAFLIPLP